MITGNCDVEKKLEVWLSDTEKIVVAGIGNPLRMDDFVGTKIVQVLQGKVSRRVYLIECETVPENFMHKIVEFNPTHILLIDAAFLGLKPGDSRLVKPERLASFRAYSTHALPLKIFCEYLAKMTKAKIALLLIEPEKADFGEGLTSKVETSSQKIVEILLRTLP
jgi:hydrogenase 3 maturation protease